MDVIISDIFYQISLDYWISSDYLMLMNYEIIFYYQMLLDVIRPSIKIIELCKPKTICV